MFAGLPLNRLGLVVAAATLAVSPAWAEDMNMKVEGRNWAATRITTVAMTIGDAKALSITGLLQGEKTSNMSFIVYPEKIDNPVGHYELQPGTMANVSGKKHDNGGGFNVDMVGGDPMEDGFSFQSGTLDIVTYDAGLHTITGTFAGQLVNHSKSRKIEISNGVFTALEIGQ